MGLGPGTERQLTPQACEALREAGVVLGYKTYLNLAAPLLAGKEVLSSGMKQEVARAEQAVRLALQGKRVVVLSGGDPGVYGMAGPVLELAPAGLEVEVIPGITAANAAAALLGAPLMHDFACMSLSDLLTPWETIERRLAAAAEADFIIVLYNPRSTGRAGHLEAARRVILSHRSSTVTGWVKNCGREDEQSRVTTLAELDTGEVDMFTTVVVGNSHTFVQNGRMITPRGYKI